MNPDVVEVKGADSRLASVFPLRRAIEQAIAALFLAVFAIPIGLTALAAWLSCGRPLLFRQARAGLNMQQFTIAKFRTMHDTRDALGNLLPDHLRETKASRFMRRIRVDEFPQLVSVARGEMSFFGPRPLLPATILAMGELGRARCRILPGLSGWAQVNGNTRLDDKQKLALDVWYVDHKNLRLDLYILMQTVVTLLRSERVNVQRIREAEDYVGQHYGARAQS